MAHVLDILRPGTMTSEMIDAVIGDTAGEREKQRLLYLRYRGHPDGTPILKRKLLIGNDYKVNQKLNTNLAGVIARTKTGYFGGKPVGVNISEDLVDKKIAEFSKSIIDSYIWRSSWNQVHTNSVKYATVCGASGRLLYSDDDAETRVRRVNPWEVILLDAPDPTNPPAALRVYATRDLQPSGEFEETEHCTYYDRINIIEFVRTNGRWIPVDSRIHFFGGCPLYMMPNNEELQGDIEEVITLHDGYNEIMSSVVSEVLQLAMAYMYFKNCKFDNEVIRQAMRTGAFRIETSEDSGEPEIGFIQKNISIDPAKYLAEKIQDDAMHVTGTPNMADESFTNNLSGVAIGYKLVNLETRCIMAEQEFRRALNHEFTLLCNFYRTRFNVQMNPEAIEYTFTRNLPRNWEAEAKLVCDLYGKISDETLFDMLTFTDAKKEKARLAEEGKYEVVLPDVPEVPGADARDDFAGNEYGAI